MVKVILVQEQELPEIKDLQIDIQNLNDLIGTGNNPFPSYYEIPHSEGMFVVYNKSGEEDGMQKNLYLDPEFSIFTERVKYYYGKVLIIGLDDTSTFKKIRDLSQQETEFAVSWVNHRLLRQK